MKSSFRILIFLTSLWSSLTFSADVIILSAPGGHDSATQRLQQMLLENGVTSTRVNVLQEVLPPGIRSLNHPLYLKLSEYSPKLLGGFYDRYMDAALEYANASDGGMRSAYNEQRLLKILHEEKPKVVLVTFGYIMEVVAYMSREGMISDLPIGFIPTDYGTDFYWSTLLPRAATMTFAPSDTFRKVALNSGLSEAQITTAGIPASPRVLETLTESEVEQIRRELGFKASVPTVFVAGGSGGVVDYKEIIRSIEAEFGDREVQVLAATGKNKSNFNMAVDLKEKMPANVHLEVMGYDARLPLYIKYLADVLVTKPGGLTTTEIALMGKPLVLLAPAVALEKGNMIFFEEEEMAVSAKPEEVGRAVLRLVNEPALAQKIVKNQKKLADTHSTQKIIDWVRARIAFEKTSGVHPYLKALHGKIVDQVGETAADCRAFLSYLLGIAK